MRKRLPQKPPFALLALFAFLSLSGARGLFAGRIELGVEYMKTGKSQKALDIFCEVWAVGGAEERKLASFYLDRVVEGDKNAIP